MREQMSRFAFVISVTSRSICLRLDEHHDCPFLRGAPYCSSHVLLLNSVFSPLLPMLRSIFATTTRATITELYGQVRAPFQNLNFHTHLQCQFQVFWAVCLCKYGTQLHAQAAALGSPLVDVAILPERIIGLHPMSNPCGWIDIGQLAPRRSHLARNLRR